MAQYLAAAQSKRSGEAPEKRRAWLGRWGKGRSTGDDLLYVRRLDEPAKTSLHGNHRTFVDWRGCSPAGPVQLLGDGVEVIRRSKDSIRNNLITGIVGGWA